MQHAYSTLKHHPAAFLQEIAFWSILWSGIKAIYAAQAPHPLCAVGTSQSISLAKNDRLRIVGQECYLKSGSTCGCTGSVRSDCGRPFFFGCIRLGRGCAPVLRRSRLSLLRNWAAIFITCSAQPTPRMPSQNSLDFKLWDPTGMIVIAEEAQRKESFTIALENLCMQKHKRHKWLGTYQ